MCCLVQMYFQFWNTVVDIGTVWFKHGIWELSTFIYQEIGVRRTIYFVLGWLQGCGWLSHDDFLGWNCFISDWKMQLYWYFPRLWFRILLAAYVGWRDRIFWVKIHEYHILLNISSLSSDREDIFKCFWYSWILSQKILWTTHGHQSSILIRSQNLFLGGCDGQVLYFYHVRILLIYTHVH